MNKILSITIMLFPIAICQADNANKFVEKPSIVQCSDGSCISGQFNTAYGNFTYVANQNVNLRSKPDIGSSIVSVLKISETVTIMHKNEPVLSVNNNTGQWVFIKTRNGRIEGWLFDYYVAYIDKFVVPNNWKIKQIKYTIGDSITVIDCEKNATFRGKLISTYHEMGTKNEDKLCSGKILIYHNIVWFKKDKEDDFPIVLFFNDVGQLSVQDEYRDCVENMSIKFF